MEQKKFQIKIESILGGHSSFQSFSAKDQFIDSLAIDPDSSGEISALGYISPSKQSRFSGSVSNIPMWIDTNPKNSLVYVYDAGGSVYSLDLSANTISGLGDLNDGGTAAGNGMEYYDNYMYFSRSTTVARYGPLNGTPAFTDDYWVGILGKTALSNTTYPTISLVPMPNHILHRHRSDGKLYIVDVVGNQGYLHYISTIKTTVEGDTDDGSTYQKVNFGYGEWPTAIESYGSDIVVALYEGSASAESLQKRAKLSFWDTTSPNFYKIIDVEFPDPVIFALKNSNGVLYVISGQFGTYEGVRVSRFIGGYGFEQVAYIERYTAPTQGAVDAILNKIIFGTSKSFISGSKFNGCVLSVGSKHSQISNAIFNIVGGTNTTYANNEQGQISAVKYAKQNGFVSLKPIIGWTSGLTGSGENGIDGSSSTGADHPPFQSQWQSQVYKIGRKFKITEIRLLLSNTVSSFTGTLSPSIWVDDLSTQTNLVVISNTNYPDKRTIIIKPENLTGEYNFCLQLDWLFNTQTLPVALPITIEYEILNE